MADKYFASVDAQGVLEFCLIEGVHPIPAGAVAVDEKTWFSLTQERTDIWKYEDGKFVKYPAPQIVPDLESMAATERAWRNTELYATDGLVARHRDQVEVGIPTTLTAAQYREMQKYRQALREWSLSPGFPHSQYRPILGESLE